MLKCFLWIFAAIILAGGLARSMPAQSNELEEELKEAETRAKIAEAKQRELKARFPLPSADALKTSTAVSGDNVIETRIQGYKAMNDVAQQIARQVKYHHNIGGLIVHRESDYAMIAAYLRTIQQIEAIITGYGNCKPAAVGNPRMGVDGLSSLILGALPLFKTDTTLRASEFDIDEEAFWASLSESLAKHQPGTSDILFHRRVPLYNVFVSPLSIPELNVPIARSTLQDLLEQVNALAESAPDCPARPALDKAVKKVKVDLGVRDADAPTSPPPVPAPAPSPSGSATASATVNVNIAQQEPAKETPTKPAVANSFVDYLRVERLLRGLESKRIYWIKIKSIKAGGTMRIKSSPIVDLFRGGSSVKFSGGAIAYYYVFDSYGSVIQSGNLYGYTPYKGASSVAK